MDGLRELRDAGPNIWLDDLGRDLLDDGTFDELVAAGVSGVTSNPSTFLNALRDSARYDREIAAMGPLAVRHPRAAFETLAIEDVRRAADVLRPAYERSDRSDGFVSFELDPRLADDEVASIEEAERILDRIARPNVMIKVPATQAGVGVVRELTARGRSVNVTLLFSVPMYERIVEAYLEGLDERLAAGRSVSSIASVASFFVSRVDAAVAERVADDPRLRGRVAIANAVRAYLRSDELFSGPRWERLAAAGARPQRLLWASTATKDPAMRDVAYLEALVAPDTVVTVPRATLRAFADHGEVDPDAMASRSIDAGSLLRRLEELGVDLDALAEELLRAGLARFRDDMESIAELIHVRASADVHVAA